METVIVAAFVLIAFGAAVVYMIRKRKKGGSCGGCNCSCGDSGKCSTKPGGQNKI